MAKLILKFKDQVMQEFPFFKESMTIGRNPENDIQIDNLAVSGHHAKIDKTGSKFILTDLQSTNSTFVNDKKIVSHSLKDRDKIQVGKHVLLFLFSETDRAENDGIGETMILDTAQQRELLGKQEIGAGRDSKKFGVLSFLGSSAIGEVKLIKKLTRIGKADNCEVKLSGMFMGATAAAISKRPSGYTITFTGGMTKLKVNGQVIKGSVQLNDYDTIELGSYKLQFYEKEEDAL
jgi:pSer/pThr/pTyr-binding forkhead associated (FHA) protein